MTTFDHLALDGELQQYLRDERKLLAEAEARVIQWKFATEPMFGLFPLFEQIGFHIDDVWRPTKRRWLDSDPDGFAYEHGIDGDGKVRIIKQKKGFTNLFCYLHGMVDDFRLGGPGKLTRYIVEKGRTTDIYDASFNPRQFEHETYEYDGQRCVKSVGQSWFVSDEEWTKASWTTTCEFEYDDEGLSRVFRDMGKIFGGRKLVYVRKKTGPLKKRKRSSRRPFVAYTVVPPVGTDAAQHVYSEAYGLEMMIDDAWPIDTALFVGPELVHVVTHDTGVTSMGVQAGISSMPGDGDLKKAKAAGAKWMLLEGSEARADANVKAALAAKLNVVLVISEASQIQPAVAHAGKLTPKQLVVAFRPIGNSSPKSAQTSAVAVRKELAALKCESSQVIIASRLTKDDVMDYLLLPDIDGVLLEKGWLASTLEILTLIALNSH